MRQYTGRDRAMEHKNQKSATIRPQPGQQAHLLWRDGIPGKGAFQMLRGLQGAQDGMKGKLSLIEPCLASNKVVVVVVVTLMMAYMSAMSSNLRRSAALLYNLISCCRKQLVRTVQRS